VSDERELRAAAEKHLRALAGENARLREDQWTAIRALVAEKRRALVVQRTGWGKSAVYFVATALLRAAGAGPTVIVSPLLALIRNQVEAAARAGIHARTINSANLEDWQQVYAEVRDGAVDVLLVSPERLNNPGFRDNVLPHLTSAAGLIVIDEAHNVCPAEPADQLTAMAADHAIRIAAEGRKFGLYLLVSTQRPQKIPENVLSQADNLVLMRINSLADAAFAEAAFSFVPPSLIQRSVTFHQGEGLIAGKISPQPALLRFGARISQEGGADVPATWAAAR